MSLLTTHDLENIIDDVINIAHHAGEKIMAIYNSDFSVDHKDDKSPLTEADLAAHTTICRELNQLTPDIPILSEESATIAYAVRRTWPQYWLVDPLDGTREFIKQNGEFTVNIALIEGNHPVLGVIQVPVTKVCYTAIQGKGAYRQDTSNEKQQIQVKKTSLDQLVIAASRSHGNKKQETFITQFPDAQIVTIGSSLKLCMLAEGKIDIYPRFGPTSEWDTAAAQCIVEQAGGAVTTMDLAPLTYNSKESLPNPHFLVIADPAFDWLSYLIDII